MYGIEQKKKLLDNVENSIEIDPQWTKLLDLAGKEIKLINTTVFHMFKR